jgi:taurine dioxygenase
MTRADQTFELRRADAVLGAQITGLDLSRELSDASFTAVEAAFDAHSVIVIRDQSLTPGQQLAFAARFGGLEINAFDGYALKENPGVLRLSNIQRDGRNIGYADAGSHWHSDMSYTATPPRCTMLHALEVPHRDGQPIGDTLFASVGAAYEALPAKTRRSIAGLRAVHRFAAKERGFNKPVVLTRAQIGRFPDVTHPVVRTHPNTGRKGLYVSLGECIAIEGMADDAAQALISELALHIRREAFIYRHRWRVGDLLMWDNCAVQHRAIKDYELPERRLMHRVTVNGSAPF